MRRLAVALLLLAAAGAAVWSWSRFAADRVAAEVCDRVASGDFAGAVEASGGPDAAAAPPDGSSAAGRTIAECRCVALAELDRLDEGLSELSAAMLAPGAADWVPPLDLTRLVVAHLRDTGRPAEAAVVARRAAAVHPDDGPLRYLEFTARATSEGEAAAAASMAAELDPAGGGHADLRLLLATVFERRADLDAARRALGDAPFAADPAAVTAWTRARLRVAALDDDLDEARRVRDAWTAAGAAPSLVLAGYATALSLAQLEDPEAPTLRMLLVAVGHGDAPPPGAVDPDRTPDPDRADDRPASPPCSTPPSPRRPPSPLTSPSSAGAASSAPTSPPAGPTPPSPPWRPPAPPASRCPASTPPTSPAPTPPSTPAPPPAASRSTSPPSAPPAASGSPPAPTSPSTTPASSSRRPAGGASP